MPWATSYYFKSDLSLFSRPTTRPCHSFRKLREFRSASSICRSWFRWRRPRWPDTPRTSCASRKRSARPMNASRSCIDGRALSLRSYDSGEEYFIIHHSSFIIQTLLLRCKKVNCANFTIHKWIGFTTNLGRHSLKVAVLTNSNQFAKQLRRRKYIKRWRKSSTFLKITHP